MIPNPIHKVLSTLSTHEVQYLLMGGQACVLYGATEFSRDCDITILCDHDNLQRLQAAADDLQAKTIAIPSFKSEHLDRGHAVHFRCQRTDVAGMRLDVMAKLRGVAPFHELWLRRTSIEFGTGLHFELMGLSDLVAAKKTQRDKDWPMLRRLIEAHYAQHQANATEAQLQFWLLESRTPEMIIQLATQFPDLAKSMASQRALLAIADHGDAKILRQELSEEESREREADRLYWEPLKRELEELRRSQRRRPPN